MGTRSTVTITGGASAEVNGTFTECDAYNKLSFTKGPRWTAHSVDRQKSAHVEATRVLDQMFWSSTTQALIDADTPPDDIVTATYELAGALTANPNQLAASNGSSTGAVRSVQASTRRVDFYNASVSQFANSWAAGLPDIVVKLIVPYLGEPGADSLGVASGTDGESSFTEEKRYAIDGSSGETL